MSGKTFCDVCEKEVGKNFSLDFTKAGKEWLSIRLKMPEYESKDFCSRECMIQFIEENKNG